MTERDTFAVNDLPPRMSLMQAVAWIATHDPVVVLRASLEDRECARAIVHLGDDNEWCGTQKGISLHAIDLRSCNLGAGDAASDELIRALRDGKISALGSYFSRENGWGMARPIPAAEWDLIVLDTVAGDDRKLVPCHRRDDGGMVAGPVENWRVIGIEADTMARVWPAAEPETSRPPPPRQAKRAKPTELAVRTWQRERVETWPDDKPAPAEDADWAAISAHFGDGLRRDDYRRIREAETPIEWRKQGKRKPWGQVKAALANTAEKSAKLPRQN